MAKLPWIFKRQRNVTTDWVLMFPFILTSLLKILLLKRRFDTSLFLCTTSGSVLDNSIVSELEVYRHGSSCPEVPNLDGLESIEQCLILHTSGPEMAGWFRRGPRPWISKAGRIEGAVTFVVIQVLYSRAVYSSWLDSKETTTTTTYYNYS
jgi:hypothetical protein